MIVRDFAKCVVRSHRQEARTVILSNVSDQDIRKKYRTLIDERCLSVANPSHDSQLRFSIGGFKFAMANALVTVDFPTPRPWNFASVPAVLPSRPSSIANSSAEGEVTPLKGAQGVKPEAVSFNECVGRTNPTAVYALMFTIPDSPEENAAFAALGDTFSKCAEVGQISFERDFLKGTLAVAFYRLAANAEPATLKN
jgi:hypothetical protein